tara:strand:+ start:1131 stop:1646 length:516 start_codon:yes stop_codon:yes gene_type:complete
MKNYKNNNVFIGIGSNLKGHMNSSTKIMDIALLYLSLRGLRAIKVSNIYKSRPLPSGLGPVFFNRIILVNSKKSANNILLILKDIECIFGRKKNTINNSPRILDLDLIDCRGEIINNDELIIPHPKLCVRDFVLRPLYELDSNWIHPVYYKKIKSLLVKNNRYSINSAIKV